MRALHTFAVLAAVSITSAGCSESPLGVDGGSPTALNTGSSTYTLERLGGALFAQIDYDFTNRTGSTVFIPNCRGGFSLVLEKKGVGWKPVWGPSVFDCESAPITIESGETRPMVLSLAACAPEVPNCSPKFQVGSIDGIYRIKWHTGLSSYDEDARPAGPIIPVSERFSNQFRLLTN